jgi:Ca2+-transporting ATPase
MASEGLRVLAIAQRRLATLPERLEPASLEGGLSLLGLVGMIDPPREGARESVAQCRAAGIVPVMITGDHPVTALAVARQLGLATDEASVITGPELARLGMPEFERRVEELRVYAGCHPSRSSRSSPRCRAAANASR